MRIYISLLGNLAGIVAAEPTARLLKRLYKGAFLTWITSRHYSELLKYNPYVDAVHEVSCLGEWVTLKPQIADTVFDLNLNQKICVHCGLQLFKDGRGSEVNCNNWYDFGPLLPALLSAAGLPPVSDAPTFWNKPAGITVFADLLGRPYIVIHTTSHEPDRAWPLNKWQALCDWLRALGYMVVEISLIPSGLGNVRHCKCNDFNDIACLIDGASFFIGIDSGFAHLANALKKKSLLIFGQYRGWTHYFPYTGFFEQGASIVRAHEGASAQVSVDAVKSEFIKLARI